ncbi:MAG: DNA/RNA nuclease SfsA [Firmicutes bacterium]|jgi:sugar fermentation stimulation protein A|nr:DNA/RNA nuclease SfsA [Bacillota bacterium]
MKYDNITEGIFLERPNRFIARVMIGGTEEKVHVKNTGRCRELLKPGAKVFLEKAANPDRKTKYDLVAVVKDTGVLFNIDSQAPNAAVKEWLEGRDFDRVRPEVPYGDSRMDFYMEKDGERFLMEVKGCTLEFDGVGYFPDAPTERGAKHLRELTRAAAEGYRAVLAYVIQMEGVEEVLPHTETDPDYAEAYGEAEAAGVETWFFTCRVEPAKMIITGRNVKKPSRD